MADFNDLQRMSDDLICRTVEAIEYRAHSILRHWYAGCVLAGDRANFENGGDCDYRAKAALAQADAVLARIDAEQKGAKP